MSDETRLMLIDGHSLIHRAFHALPEDLMTSSGELTNAVIGFANILFKEIEELSPTHIIMAFDRPSPTFRHEAYAGYKATRQRTPPTLASQFTRVRQLAGTLNIPIYELDGFEADDVLGTLSRQAEEQNIPTVIVTGDLDALQLVSDRVHVLTPGRGITETVRYDREAVRRRYNLEPVQLPDWKALVGDPSDNIPGVSGIGGKTASDLLGRYGTLEGVFEHLEELPARRRDALAPHRSQALEGRELTRIVRDVPVSLELERAARRDVRRTDLIDLLRELEARRLIERVQSLMPAGSAPAPAAVNEPAGTSQQLSMFGDLVAPAGPAQAENGGGVSPMGTQNATATQVIQDMDALRALLAELRAARSFAVDSETTSTDPLRAALVGLSFATSGDSAWYLPVGHAQGKQLPLPDVLEELRPVLEDPSIEKFGHNLKYDYAVLARHGIRLGGLAFDTMIAAYLVNPMSRSLSLSALALSEFGIEMTPIEQLIGKGKSQITMDLVDINVVAAYAGADAAVTFRLRDELQPKLVVREIVDLFRQVEMPLVSVLADMEMTGVSLDTGVLAEMSREMTEIIGTLEGRIYERVSHRFNLNSTQQLGQVLFGELKLPSGRRTKTGYSTDSEVLENLRGKHPIVDDILEHRQLIKLKNTYVDALPTLINPDTGRVHTDFNQTVAATGRLSSSNPNLQNIPIRGELGRKIRRAFVPGGPDHVLLAADYSQIELRILASMSGDERLMTAFRSGDDVHRATAAAVFKVAPEEVTSDQRRIAKIVNFGIIYGIGESRLAFETGISRAEAAEFIASYNEAYSGVKSFMDRLRRQAALHGYVATLMNRRRYLPDIHSNHPGIRTAAERAAINMPIQGTAADIIKVAMIRLHASLSDRYSRARMVLQVHDELVFDLPKQDLEPVALLVQDTMEHAIDLNVPLEVELRFGNDWYDMTPLDRTS